MTNRQLLYLGFLSGPLFAVSLIVFGRLEPGYSHYTKSVSELGGLRVRFGLAFGFFGLLLPGLMAAGVAFELRRLLQAARVGSRSSAVLIVFCVMNALTMIPADFSLMWESPWTWAHAFFALGSPLVFFAAIPGCAWSLRALGASKVSTGVFVVLGYLPLAEFLLYGPLHATPGIVQRLTILTIHAATAWLGWILLGLHQTEHSKVQRAD